MDVAGIAVATITPLRAGGFRLDTGLIREHIELLKLDGAQGVVPCGTNGEFPSLTQEEKKKVIAATGQALRNELFMLAGAGSCSLPEALDLMEHAAGHYADGALVVPPWYYRDAGDTGIICYFGELLEKSPLPVYLYNIPKYTGIAISDKVIDALYGHVNLAGIKDTGGDPQRTRALVESYPNLRIFGGSDSLAGEAVAGGVAGVITGAGNFAAGLLRDLWEVRHDGHDGISAAAARVVQVREIIDSYPWVAATKYAVSLRGLPETHVRVPLTSLTQEQKCELSDRLKEQGFV